MRPDAVELLPKIVRHYGEPFADHSAMPFVLPRAFRARARDGGAQRRRRRRELRRLSALHDQPCARWSSTGCRSGCGAPRALSHVVHLSAGDPRRLRSRLGRFALAAELDREDRYLAQRSMFTAAERARLYTPEYRAMLDPSRGRRGNARTVAFLDRHRTARPVSRRRCQTATCPMICW